MTTAHTQAGRAAIILAAGQGTRMKSKLPKVLHAIGGRPAIDWVIALAQNTGCSEIVVVVGNHSPEVAAHVSGKLGPQALAVQDPPLGTGHAALSAKQRLAGFVGPVLIMFGDTPLVTEQTLEKLIAGLSEGASVAVLGFEPSDPLLYGRLVVSADGNLERIVEARDASPKEAKIGLCNAGIMAIDGTKLFGLLDRIGNTNAKGEYYLTDIVGLARADGLRVSVTRADADEVLGIDTRAVLAVAEATFQGRMRAKALENGVTLIAPGTVFFSHDTRLAEDVLIEPNVVFGPGVTVEKGATIRAFSHLEGAHVGTGSIIGPFARLRPGADLGADVHIGNFVEVKKSTLGDGVKANHLAYLGDATIGAKTNIGAGTITCNYDGFDKFQTTIGAGAFIGSDTMLVAPVSIGAGAYTGSGSTITKDVPANALSVERSDQRNVEGWAERFRAKKLAAKAAKEGQTK